MIKKYLKFSTAAVILLFILDIILFRQFFDQIFLVLLGLSILYSFCAFAPGQTSSSAGKALNFLVLPLSILSNALLLLILLLMAFNYPPTKSFQGKVALRQPEASAVEARSELVALIEEVPENCFQLPDGFDWEANRYDHTQPGLAPLFSESCGAERQKLLGFITANKTATPYTDYKGELVLPLDTEFLPYKKIINMFKIEMTDISRLLADKKNSQASERYLQLWRGISGLATSQEGLVHTVLSANLVSMLAELYEKRDFAIKTEDAVNLSAVLVNIPALLDSAMADALVKEHGFQKDAILHIPETGWSYGTLDENGVVSSPRRSPADRFLKWPFFDALGQLQIGDAVFADIIEIQQLESPELEERLAEFNSRIEEMITNPYSLKNPMGKILFAIAVPSFDGYIEKKKTAKDKVFALHEKLRKISGR